MNSKLRQFLMIITIILLLALMAWLVDWRLVWQQLQSARPAPLVGAWLALLLGQLFFIQRWRSLVGGQVAYRKVFDAANIGQLLNLFIPLRPGEPARIYVLHRSAGISLAQVTSSVLVERWFEQLLRLMTLAGAVAFGAQLRITPKSIFWLIALLVSMLVIAIWLFGHQDQAVIYGVRWLNRLPWVNQARAQKIVLSLLQGLAGLSSPARLLSGFFLSILSWGCFFLYHLLVLQALNLPFQSSQQVSLALAGLALSPPSAPTQPGLYHASLLAPLSLLGFPAADLAAWTVVLHGLQISLLVPLGVWGAMRSHFSFSHIVRPGERQDHSEHLMTPGAESLDRQFKD